MDEHLDKYRFFINQMIKDTLLQNRQTDTLKTCRLDKKTHLKTCDQTIDIKS
jgi:hypothetical protein